MPRTARIYFPDGIFHVISRCAEKKPLLDGTEERDKYLELLGRALYKPDSPRLLAWCIMSTHIHLVLKAGEDPLSTLAKRVHSGYAVWKNRRDKRLGQVFADRPKSILVEADAHLLELVRYVHNNPVRAGVVAHPDHSTWSSHRFYAGHATPPPWLDTSLVMSYFPGGPRKGARAFAKFVDEGIGEGRRPDLSGDAVDEVTREVYRELGRGADISDSILGSPKFVERVLRAMDKTPMATAGTKKGGPDEPRRPGLRELFAAAREVLDVDELDFKNRPKARGPRLVRRVVTWFWVKQYKGKQADISRYLHVGRDQVTRWYTKAIESMVEIEPILQQMAALLPEQEPLLAKGKPTRVNINIEYLED